jgi:hypothetical protein
MSSDVRNSPVIQPTAPSIAPAKLNEVLQDADALLALMGREPLYVVAELADTLIHSAHVAGAWEIEAAASDLRSLASAHGPVALNGAMHALAEAIARAESRRAA